MNKNKFIKYAGMAISAIGAICTFLGDRMDVKSAEDEMREAVAKEVTKQLEEHHK